jgi:RNA polymerase sigma factor (sigma-70 family)
MRWLLTAIRGLSKSEREVLALCDWAGLSYAEAADAIGMPVGTVRSRLARSRQHLRDRAARDQRPLGRAGVDLAGTEDH